MFDPNQHVAKPLALDGTQDGRCMRDAAFLLALANGSGGLASNSLPLTCSDLLDKVSVPTAFGTTDIVKIRRNTLVYTLTNVSDTNCGNYIGFLQTYQGNLNNIFGIGSQAAGLIGALTSGGAAQVFAALASGIVGARATINNGLFHEKALEVITMAFERRRQRDREELDRRLLQNADDFNPAAAIGAAIRYHNDCSVDVGFQELASAVQLASPPTADDIANQLAKSPELFEAVQKRLNPPVTISTTLSVLPTIAPPPPAVVSADVAGDHAVIASSFADPADVAAYRAVIAAGGTEAQALQKGDNGKGKWGDDTTSLNTPMCALPPEDWQAKWGIGDQARGKKIRVTYNAKQVICELRDTMPAQQNIRNGAGIDLNPGAAMVLGEKPPFLLHDVHWQWVE